MCRDVQNCFSRVWGVDPRADATKTGVEQGLTGGGRPAIGTTRITNTFAEPASRPSARNTRAMPTTKGGRSARWRRGACAARASTNYWRRIRKSLTRRTKSAPPSSNLDEIHGCIFRTIGSFVALTLGWFLKSIFVPKTYLYNCQIWCERHEALATNYSIYYWC